MRPRLAAIAVVALLCVTAASGCGKRDPLQVGSPEPASPAAAPAATASPEGAVWRIDGARHAQELAVSANGKQVAAGVDNPPRLAILNASDGAVAREVTLDAAASGVVALPDGGFRAVAGRELVTAPPRGAESRVRLKHAGGRLALLPDGGTAVVFPAAGRVGVYDSSGALARMIKTGGSPAGIAVIGTTVAVVDAAATSLTAYHWGTGERAEGLRAGNGALHVTAGPDRRFVVADTRDGELLVYATNPLYLRQRYPVPGSPYGMAYDPKRNRLWVTLTGKNQVVGFELAGAAPREVARHDTVRQPNSVAVDPASGTVFVAGQTQGVVQSIPG